MDGRLLLFWYGLDGTRKGILHASGNITHEEIACERDALTLAAYEKPEKYDRILWWDMRDEAWREHYVREVRNCEDGTYEIYAEDALFETRLDYLEGFRLENASYYDVLEKLVPYTRFNAGDYASGGVNQATAWITRKSVLEGIRKLESIYNVEFYSEIDIDEDRGCVSERRLSFCAEQGVWRGLRLTRGKNLNTGKLVVEANEVTTALYGYGASFGAYDEDGNATGGFTRRLTFGIVNGGVDYVENVRAKEKYGRIGADGVRMNNYGHVIFDDIEKPAELYRKTHEELQKRTSPKTSYVIDEQLDMSERYVGLGDVVLVSDTDGDVPVRCGLRVTQRIREFGKGFTQKIRLGEITAGTRSHFAAYERRCGNIKTFDDALVAAGLKEPEHVEQPDKALSIEIALRSAKRADGSDIDLRYRYDLATDDEYRFDVVVKNNLAFGISSVNVTIPKAGIDEKNVHIGTTGEKLYTVAVHPSASDVAVGSMNFEATASCPAGNVGLAWEYAACEVAARHVLPESSMAKPTDVIPDDLTGDGTFENPYTVQDVRRCACASSEESALEDVWLSGYIVGWADMDASNGLSQSTFNAGIAGAAASNIVLADAPGERNVAAMCAVNLSTATKRRKAVRAALNLADNPDMVGMRVWVQGDVLRYGRVSGMKRTDEYRFCDSYGKWHGWWTIDGALGESLKG